MIDPVKTNHELIEEISFLKQRIRELEKSESECKRAESQREAALEALRESETKYRTLIETTNTGFVIVDEKGIVLDANIEYIRLTGHVQLSDILGRSVVEWTADYEKEKNEAAILACFQAGYIRNLEIDYVDSKGYVTPIELNATCHFHALLSESPDPTFSFTLEGRYKYVNKAFANGVGKPVEDIIDKTMWDVFPKEEADKRFASLSHVFRTGEEKVIEVRVPRHDGERYYLTTITPIKGTKGEMLSVICSSKDITERKRMEAQLRESEERYRALFEYSGTAVIIIEEDTTISLANEEFAHRTGYAREEIEGKKRWTEFVVEEDLKWMLAQHQLRREHPEKAMATYEFHFKSKSGEIRNALLNITLIPGTRKSIASLIDITERKQMEEKSRESEVRCRAQYQGNPMPTFTWRKNGDTFILEEYNEAAQSLSKGEVAKYINRTVVEMYGDRPDVLEDLHRCFAEKGVLQRELQFEHFMPGRIIVATLAFVPPDLVMVHTEDITDRKRAEEERNRLQERLQRSEKMEALGILAGGVAHDLNNVLGILVGYSELLMFDMPKDNPLRIHVEKIMKGGVRAATIVQDLLTLARRGVHSESVANLNSIIANFQKTPEFENLCATYPHVRIKTDLAADLLNIKGSPPHIFKTFMNLLTNAVEAMPEGGLVTVTTGNRNLDTPVHGYDDVREGDYVLLSVSDTGEGIAAADIKHIFEPFYTKKIMGRSGTGLGLAVVWGTVKDHDGYIDIQSEKGKGTTLTLYFPVTREEMTPSPVAIPLSDYTGNDESILVVDDINEQRELAAKMLGKLNYRVNTVASGEEAVEYLKSNQVDLIVLDMIMHPGMDGLDTYKRILENHPKQKAIIVSGFSESDRVRSAQSLGAGAYVRKPYIIEKLGIAARKELDRST